MRRPARFANRCYSGKVIGFEVLKSAQVMHMQRATFPHVILILIVILAGVWPIGAQIGVATGNGVATPARPLPPGMKPPVVNYQDVAVRAGLTAVNVSGSEKNKQ